MFSKNLSASLKRRLPYGVKQAGKSGLRVTTRVLNRALSVMQHLPFQRFTVARMLRGDPEILVRVELSRIVLGVMYELKPHLSKTFILKGDSDWESAGVAPLDELTPTIPILIRQLFVEEKKPTETDTWHLMMKRVCEFQETGRVQEWVKANKVGGYHSATEVEQHFESLLATYSSIRERGYKSQLELRRLEPRSNHRLEDEIRVTVGSKGTIYFLKGGTHRLYMARNLHIPRIPVRVVSIDESWGREVLRFRTGSIESLLQAALDNDT